MELTPHQGKSIESVNNSYMTITIFTKLFQQASIQPRLNYPDIQRYS